MFKSPLRSLVAITAIASIPPLMAATPDEEYFNNTFKPFLQENCIECHGEKKQKGDRRFDTLKFDASDPHVIETLTEMLDQLNLGEMPPDDELDPAVYKEASTWINSVLTKHHNAAKPVATRLRRLTRFEYERTIRDLLGVSDRSQDFASGVDFPGDAAEEGFENDSSQLTFTDLLLAEQMKVARFALDECITFGSPPKAETRVFHQKAFKYAWKRDSRHASPGLIQRKDHLSMFVGKSRAYAPRLVVKESGYYRIKIRATGANRKSRYESKHLQSRTGKVDLSQPMELEISARHPKFGEMTRKNSNERFIKVFQLEDNKVKDYEIETWLDEGWALLLNYKNGPTGFISTVGKIYHPGTLNRTPGFDKKTSRFFSDVYEGPTIRVYNLALSGPIEPSWPSKAHQTIIGNETDVEKLDIRPTLHKFTQRAFRRPVTHDEVTEFTSYYSKMVSAGLGKVDALKQTLGLILCSPNFLYIIENNEQLNEYELANRLSYFLWSSMPDEQLMQAAKAGTLSSTLSQQVERMLKHPLAEGFVAGFTNSWLRLSNLGTMPPDESKFRAYYTYSLEDSMIKETQLFFKNLLTNNLSVSHFLDSDYTFVNESLAKLYKIPNVKGNEFRKVTLTDSTRGGLLGQASVLTVTANGVDTSPVTRGIWVLENILGRHVNPPPPDVEALSPDTSGAKTIRDQLKLHRSHESCNQCHQKIDPIGFAMEIYDPIGASRSAYVERKRNPDPSVVGKHKFITTSLPIDTAGKLPTGEKFADMVELKKILLKKKAMIARCLVTKLLNYGTRRPVTFRDEATIRSILADTKKNDYPLKDLLIQVIESPRFRQK